MSETQALTLEQAAQKLSCSVSQVRKLIKAGALPTVRIGWGLRVTEEALAKFINSGGVLLGKKAEAAK